MSRTLIRRFLHAEHPPLDFLWTLRGMNGFSPESSESFGRSTLKTVCIVQYTLSDWLIQGVLAVYKCCGHDLFHLEMSALRFRVHQSAETTSRALNGRKCPLAAWRRLFIVMVNGCHHQCMKSVSLGRVSDGGSVDLKCGSEYATSEFGIVRLHSNQISLPLR